VKSFFWISTLIVAAMALPGNALLARAADEKPAETKSAEPPAPPKLDSGDTAWMLTSTGLVMLMVPGLALFYGGLVRRKNVLGTMMHSMIALSLIGIQWLLFGYSLAFGASHSGCIGWTDAFVGLGGVKPDAIFPGTSIPIFVHCMYQGMFAIITPALISGALAERIRFGPYCLFILLWATLVYDPLAHWVWAVNADGKPAGWLGVKGALDFAGGTVVHIAAGFSGLAAILALRKRIGYPEHAMHPNSMVLTLFGAGLLWFGWFGFNGGSAMGAGPLAGVALTATQVAAAAAGLIWVMIEWLHRGKPTALGLATGIVAGLVAVTPASGFVTPLSAVVIGALAALVCYVVVVLKPFLKYDDSLDAFGVHGIGGLLGALLTGLFASKLMNPENVPIEGGIQQFATQAIAAGVAVVYSFVVTFVLVKVIDLVWGFCLAPQAENVGTDLAEHGEVGFDFGLGVEQVPEMSMPEPRSSMVPPDGHNRFTVVLEGGSPAEIAHTWSELCQAGLSDPKTEFRSIYPFLTTVQGNRFRFRGGDASALSKSLERLFVSQTNGQPIKAHVER
jgi:ammonium transporter, Amt family